MQSCITSKQSPCSRSFQLVWFMTGSDHKQNLKPIRLSVNSRTRSRACSTDRSIWENKHVPIISLLMNASQKAAIDGYSDFSVWEIHCRFSCEHRLQSVIGRVVPQAFIRKAFRFCGYLARWVNWLTSGIAQNRKRHLKLKQKAQSYQGWRKDAPAGGLLKVFVFIEGISAAHHPLLACYATFNLNVMVYLAQRRTRRGRFGVKTHPLSLIFYKNFVIRRM